MLMRSGSRVMCRVVCRRYLMHGLAQLESGEHLVVLVVLKRFVLAARVGFAHTYLTDSCLGIELPF